VTRRTFVLDHNFPPLVVRPFIPEVEFRMLQDIDQWLLENVEDWAILLALSQHKAFPIHGFVTSDDTMLNLSKTLPVLSQTSLSLVVCEGEGHDPIAATGIALLHTPYIAARWTDRPELVVLKHPGKKTNGLHEWTDKLAARAGVKRARYLRANECSRDQLTKPVRSWYQPPLKLGALP
jgi:hypothetical protein